MEGCPSGGRQSPPPQRVVTRVLRLPHSKNGPGREPEACPAWPSLWDPGHPVGLEEGTRPCPEQPPSLHWEPAGSVASRGGGSRRPMPHPTQAERF